MPKAPLNIAVTGAAGQICYSLLFRIAAGDLLGPDQPVRLRLLDLPQAVKAMSGVVMELDDCAFPIVQDISITDDPNVAFKDADLVFFVGSRPRSKGMERRDLLSANAEIFKVQGRALNENAKRSVKALVVGNPANTNAYIATHFAPDLPVGAITSMIRLDHNRALTQLAQKAGVGVNDIEKLTVWGNHSPTMFADWSHATVNGKPLAEMIGDDDWYRNTLIPTVAQRGTAVIEARGSSSAASAANAALDHMADWVKGAGDRWVSMGVPSDGSCGIPEGLMCGRPVLCKDGHYTPVTDVEFDAFGQEMLKKTLAELQEEREAVMALLG